MRSTDLVPVQTLTVGLWDKAWFWVHQTPLNMDKYILPLKETECCYQIAEIKLSIK